ITELSRLVRPTLPSTVRAMLRFLFVDSLLMDYSYKGQKKKIFSTLAVCSLIFNSIKKIEKFKDSNTIDIEGPIKVFIAGAKFRSKTPNNDSEENINHTI
ncbi:PREDICTED: uncharacterized protein LOC107170624, partial [Diuraphis noxia]|uniref:uncharacterized protein LOC107170624 n=1 Tax=Diuraphis noxia TaxID=143948 RepID=UPI00076364DE